MNPNEVIEQEILTYHASKGWVWCVVFILIGIGIIGMALKGVIALVQHLIF